MDVAVDHNGDIYVADRENHLLQVYLMAMCASAHANTCLRTRTRKHPPRCRRLSRRCMGKTVHF